jgi:threonine dehydrogenase-like Zn-dependent dehydrogenase
VEPGQRVVLYPNIGCGPRGLSPCPACERGDHSICQRFWDGRLSPGIHTGNAVEATGGFAERLPAHTSMAFPVPTSIPDEVAVLADPWSVSFHAITRNPPPVGGRVVVIGAGALGTTATAILRQLYDCEVAVVARWNAQATLARGRGATVFRSEPALELVEQLAAWSGATLRHPWEGLPVCYPGKVDVVYDTIGSPSTVEVGLRVLAERGTLVQLGVSSPGRFEWTPWYFKELRLVGSNAFGVETFEGRTTHAYDHFFRLLEDQRIQLDGMLTHRFRLDEWRDAFTTLVCQGETGAIKVAFDHR